MFKVDFAKAKSEIKNSYARTSDFLNKGRFPNNFYDRTRGLINFWKAIIYAQLAETFLKVFFLFQTKPTLYQLFDSPNTVVLLSVGAYFFIMMPLFLVVNSMDAYKQIMTLCSVDGTEDVDQTRVNEFRTALGIIVTAFIVSRMGSNIIFILADFVGLIFKWVFYKRTLEYTD